MRPRKLLRRVLAGNYGNVGFRDFQRLVKACGFELERVAGSHHIYGHPDIPVKVNVQTSGATPGPGQQGYGVARLTGTTHRSKVT